MEQMQMAVLQKNRKMLERFGIIFYTTLKSGMLS